MVLDLNLRPPWYDVEHIKGLIRGTPADGPLALLKVNEEELPEAEKWFGIRAASGSLAGPALGARMRALAEATGARRLCVTRGAEGAALYDTDEERFTEHGGYPAATMSSIKKIANVELTVTDRYGPLPHLPSLTSLSSTKRRNRNFSAGTALAWQFVNFLRRAYRPGVEDTVEADAPDWHRRCGA